MHIRRNIGLAVVAIGLGLCPSVFAVSYTWDFTGASNNSNCTGSPTTCSTSAGNSIIFGPGSLAIKATAWYVNGTTGNSTLQKATLGQYTSGLGVCYPGENCSDPNAQTDNNGFNEYVLLEFGTPVDPTTMHITSSNGGDLDVSYWLGGNKGQNMNLTGLTIGNLASLGFGGISNNPGSAVGSRDVDLTAGLPSGYVNAILFGPKSSDTNDYFTIGSMTGQPAPEPSSVILLFTVAALGLKLRRRSKPPREIAG